jgi:MFS family permease
LDLFIVNLAFPYIGREYLGTSLSSLSWVLNGYTIVFAAALVPAGRWADRIGRRRMFVAGLVTFSIGSLACGLAPGVSVLIAARVVQAAGGGRWFRRRCQSCWPQFLPPPGRRQSARGRPLAPLAQPWAR